MNLLLFYRDELDAAGRLVLPAGDRRLRHLTGILAAKSGDCLRAGCVQGGRCQLRLLQDPVPEEGCSLQVEELEAPPPADILRRILILALPRPPVARRILQLVPQLGIDLLLLIRSARVEKSYFHSPLLATGVWREQLLLGMEQAMETRLPSVLLFEHFRPFIEQDLGRLVPPEALRLLPHPGSWPSPACLAGQVADRSICLAVGPEGGWVAHEQEAFARHGFQSISLGSRILRVETAVHRLCAQLDLLVELNERTT